MIIAIKEKDKVVIGYSNTENWGKLANEDYIDEENVAIKFTTTGYLFACADMNRRSDILLYDNDLLNMEITPKSVIKDVIPYIKNKLRENDKPLDEDRRWKNALIICNNDKLYDIDPLFGLYDVDDYVCHGYRVETIKSVLDDTIRLSAEERILRAVNFASKLHKESMFPLIITDTQEKQFKIIYEGEVEDEHFDCI